MRNGRRPPRARRLLGALALLGFVAGGLAPLATDADAEPPSLPRALYLEKTARDPDAALALYRGLAENPATGAAERAQARLGEGRCLLAKGQVEEALAAWRRLEEDPEAPTSAKEEARERREEVARARATSGDAESEARAQEAVRKAEAAREEREARLAEAGRLVEAATAHVGGKRYEPAREALLEALRLDPGNAAAEALLEEVGGFADRGELLRQAIRFVATNRVVDWRRLTAEVDGLRKAGMRLLREEKPHLAAAPFREAIARIDDSDFWSEMADARREAMILLRKAIEDARAKGLRLTGPIDVPAERPEGTPGARAWRGEFFALLGRMFTADADPATGVRFLDAAVAPDPTPETRTVGLTASGIAATAVPGSLRRARWIERYVRDTISPGSWSGADRLLERYDDLLVLQHAPGVLRQVDALAAGFPAGPPAPTIAEIRVYAAEPGGVAEAIRLLEPRVSPAEGGASVVVRDRRIQEQTEWLSRAGKLTLLSQASVRLTGRHAAVVRLREPTEHCPWYAAGGAPPLRIADRDATYGLDLELYAEDVPGMEATSAISVVATIRRPDRPRVLPTAAGLVRVPVFLQQSVEADRAIPHAGSVMLLGLSNPFRASGAAGDAAGGTHPDLVVLVSAVPAGRAKTGPDTAPTPLTPIPPLEVGTGLETRELDLGPLGTEILDEPPPEDWPFSPFGDASRPGAARAQRDAFLAGLLAERVRLSATEGTIAVREGHVTAVLGAASHARLTTEVEALAREEERLFTIQVQATEVPAERATAWLAEVGARATADPSQRVHRLGPDAAARLEERLKAVGDPTGLYTLDARLAARHTQLVTTRALRVRSLVTEFRIVDRGEGERRTLPVNGTAEEGILVGVRPLAEVGGLATIQVNVVLARIDRVGTWVPSDAPGVAPAVSLPHHQVERAAAVGTIGEGDTLLFAVPAPGTSEERIVLIRARHARAR